MAVTKPNQLRFKVSPQEEAKIRRRMELAGYQNLSAYLRKMALDGEIIRLDLRSLHQLIMQVRHVGSNLNQFCKRANSEGTIYEQDLRYLEYSFSEIKALENEILEQISHFR